MIHCCACFSGFYHPHMIMETAESESAICGYCPFKSVIVAVVLEHCINVHPENELKIRVPRLCEDTGKQKAVSKGYGVKAETLKDKTYSVDEELSISISDLTLTPGRSPATKVAVLSQSETLKKRCLFGKDEDEESDPPQLLTQ